MPTIEDELREIFLQHSQEPPSTPSRAADVRRRIVRHQRFRVAVVASAVAVALAASATAAGLALRNGPVHRPVTPIPTPTAAELLPGYFQGGVLVAATRARTLARNTASLTYTPTSLNFFVVATCPHRSGVDATVDIAGGSRDSSGQLVCSALNVEPAPSTSPSASTDYLTFPMRDGTGPSWPDLGVRVGRPLTITITVAPRLDTSLGTPQPTKGKPLAEVGVYQTIPFDRYPFPPRPQQLLSMSDSEPATFEPGVNAQPSGTVGKSIVLGSKLDVLVRTVAPGIITIRLNDTVVLSVSSWDWLDTGGVSYSFPIGKEPLARFHEGQRVSITVQAKHFVDNRSWLVTINTS